MPLTGTFPRALDEKLRVAVPRSYREAMGCHQGGALFVAPGTDGSLAIYAEDALERLAARLAHVPPTQQNVRAYMRLFYARAQRVELDRQGRIRIPADLAALAGLSKEAVLLGVQDHLELWNAERWQKYLAERQAHYDEIAEAAMGGPADNLSQPRSP